MALGLDGALRVLVDTVDDGSLSRALGCWTSPVTRVAVVNPTPETSTLRNLASEVLGALGKRFDALDREGITGRRNEDAWDLACTWLRAERIRHLVLLDVHRLNPRLWPALAALVATPCSVWMVVRGASDARRLEHLGAARSTGPALLASLPSPLVVDDSGSMVSAAVATQFRQIVTPAAACALTLATLADLDPCRVGLMLRRDVSITGQTFIAWGTRQRYDVPTYAQGLVRAQLLVLPRVRRCPTCAIICTGYQPDGVAPLFWTEVGQMATMSHLAAWLQQSMGRSMCRNPMDHFGATHPRDPGSPQLSSPGPLVRSCRLHSSSASG